MARLETISSRVGLLALLGLTGVLASACAAVLGIDELKAHEEPGTDGGDGAGGASASGGRTGAGGRAGTGGGSAAGGRVGSGGIGSGGGTAGATSSGGAGSDAGTGGAGSDAGDAQTPPGIVVGKVVDYYRYPLANVLVTVGGTTVTTDADGDFIVEDAGDTYDVRLTVSTIRNNSPATYGWVFEGLTRRDPLLHVYRGRQNRDGTVDLAVENVTFPIPDDQRINMVYAATGGSGFYTELNYPLVSYLSGAWIGGPTSQGTGHALRFTVDAYDFPLSYQAYDNRPVAMNESAATSVTFDLANEPVAIGVGAVAGSITSPPSSDRRNYMYVRFQEGGAINLVEQYSAPDTFSYVAPTLPNASITVAAATSSVAYAPYAVAFQDELVPGQTGISIAIPEPATLTSPAHNATGVTPDTLFRWSGGDGVSVLSFGCDPTYDAVFVVTARKEGSLPSFPEATFSLPSGEDCYWSVEGHGPSATVDAATGPDGLLSAFAYGEPRGVRRGDGHYTLSEYRYFVIAPD